MPESNRRESDAAASVAMVVAAAMIANQVAGKATRDALFLSNFEVTALPFMLIGASFFSIAMVLAISRPMFRLSPQVLVPWAFAASGMLLFIEWWLASIRPAVAAVAVYLHSAAIGAVLISGFWSIVNEHFDPRTAKKRISRIAAFGTMGGLAGGLLAERVGAVLTVSAMLPLLGLMHLFCAWMLRRLQSVQQVGATVERSPSGSDSATHQYGGGLRVLATEPYLASLASLVFMGTVAATLVDYVFKVYATDTFAGGENLMRFFAIFYTGIGLVTFALQTALSRISLEKLGLAKTVATLPSALAVGSMAALVFPGLSTAGLARAAESIFRSSLFRTSYELFYTPVSATQKRTAKPLIDVGVERLGDAVGGGTVRLFLLLGTQTAHSAMLATAALLAGLGLLVARNLHQGYIQKLEESLLNRALELDLSQVEDKTTRNTVMQTMAALDLGELAAARGETVSPTALPSSGQPRQQSDKVLTSRQDPVVEQITILRSGEPTSIPALLAESKQLEPVAAAHVIALMAWDEVCSEAIHALRRVAQPITGQLVDALLDPKQEFAIRRRIPRVLVAIPSLRAVEGLFQGLEDRRFEVRFQCGRALAHIRRRNPPLSTEPERVFSAVSREVTVDRRVWESHRLLDKLEDSSEGSLLVDEFLRKRANRSLEHVFTILSLALPEEPLRVAFRGLHTDDKTLRGTALEYLESILPKPIRQSLWPFLEDDRAKEGTAKSREKILADLMRSNQSIELNLQELREKYGWPPG